MRVVTSVLRCLGAPLSVLAIVLLAFGSILTAPTTVVTHARATPFAIDYLAFDAAGSLVGEHRAGDLYDVAAQRTAQAARAGSTGDGGANYFEFLYPPVAAAPFAPLSVLPIEYSYLLFAVIIAAALGVSARLLLMLTADLWPIERRSFVVCVIGLTATCVALFIGQLTPLLVLATLGAAVAARGREPRLRAHYSVCSG